LSHPYERQRYISSSSAFFALLRVFMWCFSIRAASVSILTYYIPLATNVQFTFSYAVGVALRSSARFKFIINCFSYNSTTGSICSKKPFD
jgi:hypothetical protein